jgi:hypothetical protein
MNHRNHNYHKLFGYICCAVAIAVIYPSSAQAAPWSLTSVKTSFASLPGAVGNGTTDDTAAINRAILYGGNSIYFPPGKYRYIGSMVFPTNTAYRVYGDGPGISTIIFEGNFGTYGIDAHSRGNNTFQVDGLTIKAQTNFGNCGTAIYAGFDMGADPDQKNRSATIRNVEIVGAERQTNPTGYFNTAIDLFQAPNAIIEDIQIRGKFGTTEPIANIGIKWSSSAAASMRPATQLFLRNAYIAYYRTGVQTSGWVEGFYMSGFELVFCGSSTSAAVVLTGANPNAVPVAHIQDGHINQISNGINISNFLHVKISHVNFFNMINNGTHLKLTNCSEAILTDNDFGDYDPGASNGIYLVNNQGARICGNNFGLPAGGSCVFVDATSTQTKILDNNFNGFVTPINNLAGANTYIRLIP